MEDIKSKAGNLTESISDFVQTKYKLTLLNAADKATGIAASTLAAVVIVFLGVFVLFFAAMALGVWLGRVVNDPALGFLLVAALFTLIIVIIVAMKKRIVFPMIRDKIINKLYEQNDQDVQGSV